MPSIHQPRRPRASPLWQIVHHGWADFLSDYEKHHRKSHGPLAPAAVSVVQSFLRCGDLAQGFTRLQCPDCGHPAAAGLVAFTCKTRNFCPSCHQRRALSTGDWIAHHVCREVPHRQIVFTMPRMLRGIFSRGRGTASCSRSSSTPPPKPCATPSAPASICQTGASRPLRQSTASATT